MLNDNIKNLLPTIIKDALQTVKVSNNLTDEAVLPVVLGVANLAVQSMYDVNPFVSPGTWDRCPTSLYFLTLQESGGKKTAVMSALTKGVEDYQRDEHSRYDLEKISYKLEARDYEKNLKAQSSSSAIAPEPDAPRSPKVLLKKSTTNGFSTALKHRGSVGLFHSDALEFFSSHSMKDGGGELISALSDLWSGQAIERWTAIEESNTTLYFRRMTAVLSIQGTVADFLNDATMSNQGFVHRLLITQAEKVEFRDLTLNEIEQRRVASQNADGLTKFNDKIYSLLKQSDVMQSFKRQSNALLNTKFKAHELILDVISPNNQAKRVLLEYYNYTKRQEVSDDAAEYSAFFARAYEHCIRLAATLAVVDDKKEIDESHALCAVGLMEWFTHARMNLNNIGGFKVSQASSKASALCDILRKKIKVNETVSKSDLSTLLGRRWKILDSDEKSKVLSTMVSNGWVDLEEVDIGGGRTRTQIRLLA